MRQEKLVDSLARWMEPIGRSWHAEVLAQCFSLVLAPEKTRPLKFRHYLIHDRVEAAREPGNMMLKPLSVSRPIGRCLGDRMNAPSLRWRVEDTWSASYAIDGNRTNDRSIRCLFPRFG